MGTEPLLCLWGQILLRNLKGRIKGAVLDEQVCERVIDSCINNAIIRCSGEDTYAPTEGKC